MAGAAADQVFIGMKQSVVQTSLNWYWWRVHDAVKTLVGEYEQTVVEDENFCSGKRSEFN